MQVPYAVARECAREEATKKTSPSAVDEAREKPIWLNSRRVNKVKRFGAFPWRHTKKLPWKSLRAEFDPAKGLFPQRAGQHGKKGHVLRALTPVPPMLDVSLGIAAPRKCRCLRAMNATSAGSMTVRTQSDQRHTNGGDRAGPPPRGIGQAQGNEDEASRQPSCSSSTYDGGRALPARSDRNRWKRSQPPEDGQ